MIRGASVHAVVVPLARRFEHSGHARMAAESVLLSVEVDEVIGWGEAAPRTYVTGETVASVFAALAGLDLRLLSDLLDFSSVPAAVRSILAVDLPRLLGGLTRAPAAAAALETALVDAVCRLHAVSAAEALRETGLSPDALRAVPEPVAASLVVDVSRKPGEVLAELPEPTRRSLRHGKVKATSDPAESLRRLAEARAGSAPGTTWSLEVNGRWAAPAALRAAGELAEAELSWVEEPVAARSWTTLRQLRDYWDIPIMLDESCVDSADLELAAAIDAASHVNVRVSKCGGPLRAALLADRVRRLGLRFQLGVQVGETGPLWAAGRMLGSLLSHAEAVEAGRQDEWFPSGLTEPGYQIDRTRYLAAPLPGPGFGVRPTDRLLRYATRQADWRAASREWERVG